MQFKKYILRLALVLLPVWGLAQTTYPQSGDKQEIILDRMEIKAQKDPVLNFSKTKPLSREFYVNAVKKYLNEDSTGVELSKADRYYIESLLKNNIEWVPEEMREDLLSKRPVLNTFYEYPAGFYETHSRDFDLSINPIINFGVMKESNNDQRLFYNTRGAVVRGRIANRIGFVASVTDNQERDPSYVQQWISERQAVPGEGYYKEFKAAGGVDYFDAKGYITFGATKYVDIAFGYDKNFIGNGQRSLFLSDFSNNALFLKLNTKIWKFNYQNLFMELHNAYQREGDVLLGKKYAAMHHLDLGLTKWLNVGFFEGVIFGRSKQFELGYLVPVIFLRSAERNAGSKDNSVVGLDFKANMFKTAQLYGQLLLDEFKLSEMKSNKGWWANKYGFQLGLKYIDVLKIKNLDLQLEWNRVRPFTYSHYDSVANYSHYNQPLAHPLMANFNEYLGVLRYRPLPKLMIEGKAMFYVQGKDSTANVNFGSNLFLSNSFGRLSDNGYYIGSGWKTQTAMASLLFSYELKENLFIELNGLIRKQKAITAPIIPTKTGTVLSAGLRWNIGRRDFWF
ncbi:MAG: hypothetical protein IPH58_07720 [Sphingobacteriales bacterium]|jgi:hypothetical protein|nr:hypothetical protein [Sphingobacteriales bacterium]